MGESIVVRDVYEGIEKYLLTALYSVEAIKSYVGIVEDDFSPKVRYILHDSIIPPNLKIGGEEVTILAVGSMGYSTIKA